MCIEKLYDLVTYNMFIGEIVSWSYKPKKCDFLKVA